MRGRPSLWPSQTGHDVQTRTQVTRTSSPEAYRVPGREPSRLPRLSSHQPANGHRGPPTRRKSGCCLTRPASFRAQGGAAASDVNSGPSPAGEHSGRGTSGSETRCPQRHAVCSPGRSALHHHPVRPSVISAVTECPGSAVTAAAWSGGPRRQGRGVGASRTVRGWGTGCVWVGTRQPLLDGLWGGHGQGSPPPTAGGSEARLPRHFSQDLPAPQSSQNACSPLSHAPSFPPAPSAFWPLS